MLPFSNGKRGVTPLVLHAPMVKESIFILDFTGVSVLE
jgi:hypothetical protein